MKINEIFYSIQGEGKYTGTPAIFVRFSGCNLRCDFCDTMHEFGNSFSEDDIVAAVSRYPAKHVVLTGGEPTLQITASLINKLHEAGKYIQVETNGSLPLPDNLECYIDWITCSPKYGQIPNIQRIDELKVVFDADNIQDIEALGSVEATYESCYYLQPCDRGNEAANAINIEQCINYIKKNPKWKLSTQLHKVLGVR